MTRFRASEGVSAKEVGGELVLLDLESGDFFVSRGVGPRVWAHLTDGGSVEEIVSEIVGRYELPEEQARADVEKFVAELEEKGFLIRDDEGAGP